MTRKGSFSLILAVAILMGLIAGCGSSEDSSEPGMTVATEPTTSNLDDFLGATRANVDYDPAETPAVLAERADAVVTGTIVAVAPGQSYAPTPGSEPRIATSVLELRVDRVLAGDSGVVHNGSVYVEVAHPAFVGSGAEDDPSRIPFDHKGFAATVPIGSNAIFFLDDRTNEPYWDTIIDEGAGRPAGARITAPFPQGFLIEDANGKLISAMESFAAMPAAWHALDSVPEVVAAVASPSG